MKKLILFINLLFLVYSGLVGQDITSPTSGATRYTNTAFTVLWDHEAGSTSTCVDCNCNGVCDRAEGFSAQDCAEHDVVPSNCTINTGGTNDNNWTVSSRNTATDAYTSHITVNCSSGTCSASITIGTEGNYDITVTGNSMSETVNINVYTRPSNPSAPTEAASSTCTNRILQRSGTPPSGVTYYWQNVVDGTSTSLGSGSTKSLSVGTYTYYLRARRTVTTGVYVWSVGTTSGITRTEYLPLNSHSLYAGNTDLCPNESSSITLQTSDEGITYKLYRVGTTLPVAEADGKSTSPSYIDFGDFSVDGEYYVVAEDGCSTLEMGNRVTLTDIPGKTVSAGIQPTGDFSVDGSSSSLDLYACNGETIRLTKNTTGLNLTAWHWKKNGTKITNSDEKSFIDVSTDGTYKLQLETYTVNSSDCYSGNPSNPELNLTIFGAIGDLSDSDVTFQGCETGRDPGVSAPSGQIVKWYTNAELFISGTPDFDGLGEGTHVYKIKASNGSGVRECISANFATVTIEVEVRTPTIYGTEEYCVSTVPAKTKVYIRDADPDCTWLLKNNALTSNLDQTLKWDITAEMYYLEFNSRTTPGTKTVRVFKEGSEVDSFTQTINADNTPAAALTFGGDYTYSGTTLYTCSNETLRLTRNFTGITASSWYWKKDGVKITNSDNDTFIDVTTDGTYELHLVSYSANAASCYFGTVSNPSVVVDRLSIQNLESESFTFEECETSRTVTIDQLSNGNAIPVSYSVKWYNASNSLLASEPNWDGLVPGTHTYKVKGTRTTGGHTCESSTFGTVTVTINELVSVNVTSSTNTRTMGTGTTPFQASATNVSTFNWSISPTYAGSVNSSGLVTWDADFFGVATVSASPAGSCGSDLSDSHSVIVTNPNAFDLFTPVDQTLFMVGETIAISWSETVSSYKYDLYYIQNDTEYVIDSNISGTGSNGTISYNWVNPPVTGIFDLVVKESRSIEEFGAQNIEVISDLAITAPSGGGPFTRGTELPVSWTGGSDQSNFSVELWQDDHYYDELSSTNLRSLPWTIPFSLGLSSTYQIKVIQGELEATSAEFTVSGCFPHSDISDKNYIYTYVARVPIKDLSGEQECFEGRSRQEVIQSIAYYDGLSRACQQIVIEATPGGNDLITGFDYDEFSRQTKSYLPYEDNSSALGSYRSGWKTKQRLEMNERYGADNELYGFSEQVLERSPRNRPEKSAAPGEVFSVDGNGQHLIENAYLINDVNDPHQQIPDFYVTASGEVFFPGAADSEYYYDTGELVGIRVRDENNGTREGETITWTNKAGQTVLSAVKIIEEGVVDYMRTLYGYDGYGNLRLVVQPQGMKLISEGVYALDDLDDPNFQNNWAFVYTYDHRHRLITKQVPGAEKVESIYDEWDRLRLTQDGNQDLSEFVVEDLTLGLNVQNLQPRYEAYGASIILDEGFLFEASEGSSLTLEAKDVGDAGWIFTKYDALNRPVMTGIYHRQGDRSEVQIDVDDTSYEDFETVPTTGDGPLFGYSNGSFPTHDGDGSEIDEEDLLTVTYYDSYEFTEEDPSFENAISVAKGQITGAKTRVLGTNTWLTSVTFYDKRYRVIETIVDNYLSGKDIVKYYYLNEISPLVTKTITTHTGGENVTIVESHTYDHLDRLLTTKQQIDGGPTELIVSNTYNEIGELIEKNLGGVLVDNDESNVTPVQSVDYKYNIRGWLTHINNGPSLDLGENDQFGMQLQYESAPGFEQYNGNIGQMDWTTLGGENLPTTPQQLQYTYDQSGRIKSADYVGGEFDLSAISYDHNGNIMSLTRNSLDILTYDYREGIDRSNHLINVSDDGTSALFNDRNNAADDYTYDDNGNMIFDLNKDIEDISYNYLNLPMEVNTKDDLGNPVKIKYIYNALGIKLRKEVRISGNTTKYDYLENMHFTGNILSFVKHAGGRAVKNEYNGFDYEYNISDLLKNVRVTVIKGGNGIEVVQRNDYYPFGLSFNPYSKSRSAAKNEYLFQGQEHQPLTGWDQYKWRNSDATIGRFFNLDPLAEDFYYNSVYAFSENKVVADVELEGLESTDANEQFQRQEAILKFIQVQPTLDLNNSGMSQVSSIEHDRITRLENGAFPTTPQAVVVHRTAGPTATSAINWWKSEDSPGYGTHFIVDTDGTTTQTASLNRRTRHTRRSKKDFLTGNTLIETTGKVTNSNSIGIELVGNWNEESQTWDALTNEQIDAYEQLIERIKNTYLLSDDQVISHFQTDPDHKELGEGNEAICNSFDCSGN